ncbi:phosphotransferase [Micromonospora sp. RB23]
MTVDAPETCRDTAAQWFGVSVGAEILEGGSSARVYHARRPDGTPMVLKVVAARPGTVDGHDLASFRMKESQIDLARRQAPRLAMRYQPIAASVHRPEWAAQVMPYFPSRDLAAPLRAGDTGAFFETYRMVATELLEHGYAATTAPAPADYLDRVVIERFFRRLPLLRRALPELTGAEVLIVNGRRCRSPIRVLTELRDREADRLAQLAPRRLGFPAHGDANTRNVLVAPDGRDFRLIDPRGSTAPLDPIYDIAKALFSLSVWDPALRRGCVVQSLGGTPRSYRAGLRDSAEHPYRDAVLAFVPFLTQLPGTRGLLDDPGWRTRLLLTHDLHVLSEAACRLSDDKLRRGADGQPITPVELAAYHYLVGALLLDDLVDQLATADEPDAERHLAGLPS